MMRIANKLLIGAAVSLMISCSEPSKEEQIKTLEKEIQKTEIALKKLDAELKKLNGTGYVKSEFDKIVTTTSPEKGTFTTAIEMPGKIISRQNILVGPELAGQIVALYVTNGQIVSKGQVLAKVDDQIIRSNIDELESSLSLANDLFERQKNLWEQKVGSELQYLQAKNTKENLQKKLSTLQTQLSKAVVRAPMSGVVDEVFLKLGEMSGMGAPICRMVDLNDIYVQAEVAEKYIGKVKKGDNVEVFYPSLNRSEIATVTAITQVINPGNRTFKIEIRVSNKDGFLKPNLLATVRLKDYVNPNTIIVPTRLVQISSSEKYIYVVEDSIARKKSISTGKSYDGKTEVSTGLTGDEQIIDLGFRDVSEGDRLEIKTTNE